MISDLLQHYLYIVMFFTGLLAATVDAIAGGGGLISLPVLLGMGVPPHIALGTNKLQSLFGTAVATHRYYRQGWIEKKGLLLGLTCSFIGSVGGALVAQVVSGDLLKKIIPILLLGVLIYSILSPRIGTQQTKPRIESAWFYFIFGTLLGAYDGFLGPGVGAFWVFLLVFFLGHNLMKATAHTKVFNLNTNIAAMFCFAAAHLIDYKIGLCMAAGQLIGGQIGAYFAIKKGVGLIRPLFIFVVSATILTLIYRNYAFAIQEHLLFVSSLLLTSIVAFSWFFIRAKKKIVTD